MTGIHDPRDVVGPPPGSATWADELRAAFAGRSVLVTGHTGFKGSWLVAWLDELGAQVTGYALDPPTDPNLFEAASIGDLLQADHRADIRDRSSLDAAIRSSEPDVILHLAAQTVVLEGYRSPVETFSVNVTGTAVVLDAIRAAGRPCAVVVVSSDKCYRNDESGRPFSEDDPLGGEDPYSASKAGTEIVTAAYRQSFFPPEALATHAVALASARAGNVIGGGDWTPHGIVADIGRAIATGETLRLRRPHAIRPWQHVLEPLGGYLTVAARLLGPDAAHVTRAWNFGPEQGDEATVKDLTERIFAAWGRGSWRDDQRSEDLPEAGVLRLSIEQARADLGWRPRWHLADAIERTVNWQRRYATDPKSARESTVADIRAYMSADHAATGGPG